MWRRIPWRALERTGARAPGAAIGWTIVVALLLLIPASQLGLNPVGNEPEETAGITTSGSALERTVTTPSSAAPSVDVAESDSSTSSSAAAELAAPDETLAGPAVPAPSVPSTTGPSTTRSTPSTATPSSSTTASSTTTTIAAPTAPSTSSSPTTSTTTGPTTTVHATTSPTTTTSTTLATTDTTPAPTTTEARNPNFAVSDSYQLESGKKGKFKVLHNDGNPGQLDQSTLEIIAAPAHAAVYRVHGNHIDYETGDDFEGTDSLRYRICTVDGVCSAATVTIQVIDD